MCKSAPEPICDYGCLCPCVFVCMCVGVYVCWCVCVLVCMCVGMYVCWCICVLVYMCVGVYVGMWVCVHVCWCVGVDVLYVSRVSMYQQVERRWAQQTQYSGNQCIYLRRE